VTLKGPAKERVGEKKRKKILVWW